MGDRHGFHCSLNVQILEAGRPHTITIIKYECLIVKYISVRFWNILKPLHTRSHAGLFGPLHPIWSHATVRSARIFIRGGPVEPDRLSHTTCRPLLPHNRLCRVSRRRRRTPSISRRSWRRGRRRNRLAAPRGRPNRRVTRQGAHPPAAHPATPQGSAGTHLFRTQTPGANQLALLGRPADRTGRSRREGPHRGRTGEIENRGRLPPGVPPASGDQDRRGSGCPRPG